MKKSIFAMGLAMMGLLSMTSCSSSDSKNGDTPQPTPQPEQEVTIQDSEYDAIINQYVDNVVLPTYSDLKTKNSALYQAVVDFGDNPSNANFKAICDAWLHGLMASGSGSHREDAGVTAVERDGVDW